MTIRTYERDEVSSGLHRLAEMISTCPDLPVDSFGVRILLPVISGTETERFGVVRELAARFARQPEVDTDRELAVSFHFNGVTYQIYAVSDQGQRLHDAETSYVGSVTA